MLQASPLCPSGCDWLAVLNSRSNLEVEGQDGQTVHLPPNVTLQHLGPRLQITLSPLESQIKSLADHGKKPPAPVVGWGLIDTGASATCVDKTAAENAGLAVVDSGPMSSATHDGEIVPIFAGRLDIGGMVQNIDTTRAYGANLGNQDLVALIGRDVLLSCVLIYNGLDGSFSLSL